MTEWSHVSGLCFEKLGSAGHDKFRSRIVILGPANIAGEDICLPANNQWFCIGPNNGKMA